jgi:undecaprenyl-diphosphatase
MEWNLNCLRAIAELRTPLLDKLMQGVTEFGGETLFMLFMLVIFWCVDKKRGYFLMLLCFTGTAVNQMLKITFCIPRPWVLDPSFEIVESARAGATGFSFPSGHTQNAVAAYGGMFCITKKLWVRVVCMALALLIPFSRLYLGVHTPLDIGVSFLIGWLLVLALYPVMEEADRRPWVLTWVIAFMVVCSGAFVAYLYLRGDTGATAEDTANYLSALENGWKLLGATVGMLVSNIADRKHIRFETQAVWWAQLIKLVVGFGCLLAIRSGLKAPLIALLGGNAAIAGGIRYLLVVLFAGCVWPLTFWWFSRLGRR